MISNYRTCGIYNNNDITTSYCHFTILLPLWTCDNCDWSTGRNCRFHGYVSQHLLWLSKKKNNEKEKCRTYSVVSADQRAKFCLNIIIIVIYLSFDCNYIFCSCHWLRKYVPTFSCWNKVIFILDISTVFYYCTVIFEVF